jgi:hypothetical protein
MSDLKEASIPLFAAVNQASLGIRLTFKLLAWLRETGKLTDEELEEIAGGLIVELGSDQERFEQWQMLKTWAPDLGRAKSERSSERAEPEAVAA